MNPDDAIWDKLNKLRDDVANLKALDHTGESKGWLKDPDPWVYVSATSFKIVGKDVRSRFGVSTRLKYNDGGQDYGTVIASALSGSDTLVTLAANNDYAIADPGGSHILSNCYYSYGNPPDFPCIFSYTPAAVGLTTPVYATQSGQYTIVGKWVHAWGRLDITSWAGQSGNLLFSLPVTAFQGTGEANGTAIYYRNGGSTQQGTHTATLMSSTAMGINTNDGSGVIAWEASARVVITWDINYYI